MPTRQALLCCTHTHPVHLRLRTPILRCDIEHSGLLVAARDRSLCDGGGGAGGGRAAPVAVAMEACGVGGAGAGSSSPAAVAAAALRSYFSIRRDGVRSLRRLWRLLCFTAIGDVRVARHQQLWHTADSSSRDDGRVCDSYGSAPTAGVWQWLSICLAVWAGALRWRCRQRTAVAPGPRLLINLGVFCVFSLFVFVGACCAAWPLQLAAAQARAAPAACAPRRCAGKGEWGSASSCSCESGHAVMVMSDNVCVTQCCVLSACGSSSVWRQTRVHSGLLAGLQLSAFEGVSFVCTYTYISAIMNNEHERRQRARSQSIHHETLSSREASSTHTMPCPPNTHRVAKLLYSRVNP